MAGPPVAAAARAAGRSARPGYDRRSARAARARLGHADAARRDVRPRRAAGRGEVLGAGSRSGLGAGRRPQPVLPFRLSAVRHVAFDDLAPTPATHFRLYFYAAVIGLVRQAVETFGSFEVLSKQFPFVSGYVNEIATFGLEGVDIASAPAKWRDAVQAWESRAKVRLPLRALARQAGLGYAELVALAAATLVDEEMRFGAV